MPHGKAAKARYRKRKKLERAKKMALLLDKPVSHLEKLLDGCSVRQLIVAMRLMRTGKETLGFDYSKVKKSELLSRAKDMAATLSPERIVTVSAALEKAFAWKSGDTSSKESGASGMGRAEDGGISDTEGKDSPRTDYGSRDGDLHGPEQGGSSWNGDPEKDKKTKEAIENAVKSLVEKKTDELMERLSKNVFTIQVEPPSEGDGDGEQSESESDGSGEEQSESGEGENGEEKPKPKSSPKKRTIEADKPRHQVFKEVCQAVNKGLNVLLVGPAGCGKTHMAQDIADVLALPFKFTGAVSSEYKLLGFMTAQGQVVRTEYREAYENGGLFLWDELDASSAQALLSFNAGLSNGHQDFPDKVVPQHKMFRAVASANTYGNGADRMYIGRNQLDAASLDRFYVVNMDYDEQLEHALYGREEWVMYVQAARQAMRKLGGIRHVISMRAIQMGLKMKGTGVSRAQIEQSCLWRHLQKDDVEKIKRAMK